MMNRYKVFQNVSCYAFKSKKECGDLIKKIYLQNKGFYSIAINAEKLIRCKDDQNFKHLVAESKLPVPDGVSAQMMLKKKHKISSIKIDLPKQVLDFCNNYSLSIAIIGSTVSNNKQAVENIKRNYKKVKVVYNSDGYDSKINIIESLKRVKTDFIFLGLGSPKQELFAKELIEQGQNYKIINCGGAIDILSGKKKRAPTAIQKLNLEWFYRMVIEPRRISRYLKLFRFFFIYINND